MAIERPQFGARLGDPSMAAAGLLVRVGFALMVVGLPVALLASRRAVVILFPIAALVLILGALMRIGSAELRRRSVAAATSPIGALALCYVAWAGVSLLWTPFPVEAGERLARGLGVGLLALLAARCLPRMMRASNLHLVPIGVGIAAIALIAFALWLWLRPPHGAEGVTAGRSAMLLMLTAWASVAWLTIKDRPVLGGGVLALAGLAVALAGDVSALGPAMVSVVAFALAWRVPHLAGRVLAGLAAALILGAPLLALLARAMPPGLEGLSGPAAWGEAIAAAPLRVLTGHGFDTFLRARIAGLIPSGVTPGLISETWFELGLLGAALLAAVVFLAFDRAGRLGFELAPATLAAMSAALAAMASEQGITQNWWLNTLAVAGVAFVAVAHGRYRTVRPRLSLGRPANEPPPAPPTERPAPPAAAPAAPEAPGRGRRPPAPIRR